MFYKSMDINIADMREMLSVWVGLLLIVNEILWTYLVSIKTSLAKTPKIDPNLDFTMDFLRRD